MNMGKTTINLECRTRDRLLQIGHKSQTYDDIITELLERKYEKDSPSSAKLRESK